MKIIKLFFLFIFIQNSSIAQSNQFFPSENASWECGVTGFAGIPFPEYRALCGDTLINGKMYSKMYRIELDSMGNETSRIYEAGTRLNLDQVFWIPSSLDQEEILYDFSLEAGQTFSYNTFFGNPNTITVASNTLVNTLDGITRRQIQFDNGEIWLEGIGSNFGVIYRGIAFVADFDPQAYCYKYDGQLVWMNPIIQPEPTCEFTFEANCDEITSNENILKELSFNFECYPNPISDNSMIQIQGFEKLETPFLSIHNMEGQLVEKINGINEEKFIFSRKNLNAGVYVFELTDGKTTFAVRKKIVLIR